VLQLCADFADIDDDLDSLGSSSCLFGNLIFLIRDCQDRDVHGKDSGYFQSLVSEYLSFNLLGTALYAIYLLCSKCRRMTSKCHKHNQHK